MDKRVFILSLKNDVNSTLPTFKVFVHLLDALHISAGKKMECLFSSVS